MVSRSRIRGARDWIMPGALSSPLRLGFYLLTFACSLNQHTSSWWYCNSLWNARDEITGESSCILPESDDSSVDDGQLTTEVRVVDRLRMLSNVLDDDAQVVDGLTQLGHVLLDHVVAHRTVWHTTTYMQWVAAAWRSGSVVRRMNQVTLRHRLRIRDYRL